MRKFILLLGLFLLLSLNTYSAELVEVISLDIGNDSQVVTVQNSGATALPSTPLAGRKVLVIQNISDVTIYIGDVNVTADETSTGGFQLQNDGDSIVIDATENIIWYGIVATSTAPCVVLEVR